MQLPTYVSVDHNPNYQEYDLAKHRILSFHVTIKIDFIAG